MNTFGLGRNLEAFGLGTPYSESAGFVDYGGQFSRRKHRLDEDEEDMMVIMMMMAEYLNGNKKVH